MLGVPRWILNIKLLAHMVVLLMQAMYVKRKYMTFKAIIHVDPGSQSRSKQKMI